MTTAVDANVLIEVLHGDLVSSVQRRRKILECLDQGNLVISYIVYAELANRLPVQSDLDRFLDDLQIQTTELTREGAYLAGQWFRSYKTRGGKRDRILADFLVGAHAVTSADRLLSEDRGFRGPTFPGLTVINPG